LKDRLNVWLIILLSAGSIVIALLAGNFFIRKKITSTVGGIPPMYQRWHWTKVAFSLLIVNGIYFYLSQLQIIALGSLKGAKETGVFAIASRLDLTQSERASLGRLKSDGRR